ncbi:ABC transporter substrate-binding protein [Actinocrispum wychmicini]|uniref:Iron complex transport system substrate-binding protein n=1 Tax=Actinocrispum wychmicini TaxID=1213861 RepID=A0A4R2JKW7_9PSEU|nr:ABC transporter substrate-binding protein [Actinocrispum wychmicini]TCO60651.1 iron complex transport system substrate-binding protein [Actinocrispum wychmicini]
MPSRWFVLPALAALALATTACGSAAPAAPPPTAVKSAGEGKTSYPLTFTNCGKNYTFTKAPSRVVLMNGGSVAEVSSLLELGLGDRIVANAQNYGTSDVDGRAAAIKALPTAGITLNNMQDIPREAMLGLRPDFVVSTYDGGFSADSGFATRDELLKAGANSYAATGCGTASTPKIDDSYTLLRDFGKIFDVADRAEKAIADSTAKIAATAGKVKDKPVKKVMIVFPGMGAEDLSSVAGNGIWNDVLVKAGAVNAFADATKETFATISKEQAAAAQVDALVVVNYQNPDPQATVKKLFQQFPQWQAAKDNRSLVLSDSIYLGPVNQVAVEKIAALVHPDAF